MPAWFSLQLAEKSGPLKTQVAHKNIPVQKVSPRVVTVSPQQKLAHGVPPRSQSVPHNVQPIQPQPQPQPQGVQPIQPNVAQLAQNVPQISSPGFQVVPGVSVVSSGMGFPGTYHN